MVAKYVGAFLLWVVMSTWAGAVLADSNKDIKDATIMILMENKSFCSGTAVYSGPREPRAGSYLFLTAAHCVRKSPVVKVMFWQKGRWMEVDVEQQVAVLNNRDQALVRTNYPLPNSVRLTRQKLKQGERVKWFGAPYGIPDVYREGYISSVNPEDAGEYLMIPSTARGDSGSGVFNARNELVAVNSKVMFLETFSLAISISIEFNESQIKLARGY